MNNFLFPNFLNPISSKYTNIHWFKTLFKGNTFSPFCSFSAIPIQYYSLDYTYLNKYPRLAMNSIPWLFIITNCLYTSQTPVGELFLHISFPFALHRGGQLDFQWAWPSSNVEYSFSYLIKKAIIYLKAYCHIYLKPNRVKLVSERLLWNPVFITWSQWLVTHSSFFNNIIISR